MYLFDTDTISNIFKKRPSLKLVQRLEMLDPYKQFISSITIAEIAITNKLILVTGNIRHFARISGLKIENWL